jgi:hypothetical protein
MDTTKVGNMKVDSVKQTNLPPISDHKSSFRSSILMIQEEFDNDYKEKAKRKARFLSNDYDRLNPIPRKHTGKRLTLRPSDKNIFRVPKEA